MKKFWVRLAVYLGSLVAIAWLNNAVMLHLHPLEYYYTPSGMLLNMAVCVTEALIICPMSYVYMKRILIPSLNEGLEKKAADVAKESYESCKKSYREYRERVITKTIDE